MMNFLIVALAALGGALSMETPHTESSNTNRPVLRGKTPPLPHDNRALSSPFSRAPTVPTMSIPSISTTEQWSVDRIQNFMYSVAPYGGLEFIFPGYQSQALRYLETSGFTTEEDYIVHYVLACIYFATSGVRNKRTDEFLPDVTILPEWTVDESWLSPEVAKCSWHGITCNDAQQITEIQLRDNRLFGLFPPEAQLLGETLEVLDLRENYFLITDQDPGNQWLARMTKLRRLLVGSTSFEYDGIPTFLNSMKSLQELDISNTFYSHGPIRNEAFRDLTNLRYLDMSGNVYTSPIPDTITSLSSLSYLYFINVVFDGVEQTLDFLVGMPHILECWMDYTPLHGGLPSSLGAIPTLASFSATSCTLSGGIPSEIGSLSAMTRMWLYNNQLTGTIPTHLGSLQNLKYLSLEGNQLEGAIPPGLCTSSALQDLGTDCTIDCPCCTCCGVTECKDFTVML